MAQQHWQVPWKQWPPLAGRQFCWPQAAQSVPEPGIPPLANRAPAVSSQATTLNAIFRFMT
jgi:hypothetical protein